MVLSQSARPASSIVGRWSSYVFTAMISIVSVACNGADATIPDAGAGCLQINTASGGTVCLDGVWRSECYPADVNTRQDTFTFSGDSFVWEEVRDCLGINPMSEVKDPITFSVDGDQPDVGWVGGTAPAGLAATVTATRSTWGAGGGVSVKGILFVDDIASPVELHFGGFEDPADDYATLLEFVGHAKQ